MSKFVSFSVLLGIIIVIGFLFYQVMITFLLPVFLAALLVVMFRPLHRWFLFKFKGRPRVAAGMTTAAVMLIALVPAAVILISAAIEATSLVGKLNDDELTSKLSERREQLGLQMPEYGPQLRYFDSSFEHLVEASSAGAAAAVDRSVLDNLASSLEDFEVTLDDIDLQPRDPSQVREDQQEELGNLKQTLKQQLREIIQKVKLEPTQAPNSAAIQARIHGAANDFDRFKKALLVAEFRRGSLQRYYTDSMRELVAWVMEFVNPTEAELDRIRRQLFDASLFRTIGGATSAWVLKIVFGAMIIVIAVYFFFSDGPSMVSSFMRLSPLDDRHEQELLEEFDRVSRAVVVATLLSAVVQGLLGGIGYWFAGVGSVFLLTVLTTVFALIPFVGAAAVWVPVCLYLLFFEERTTAAILLAIYGAAIISAADNVIKPLVLHGQSNLHPLLALLSVLGGVQALGPIGVLVGPMVVAFLQTLLNILHRELVSLEKSKTANE